MQQVFIIGSKGIPAKYGGFETFVEKLTENRTSNEIMYHIACAVNEYSSSRTHLYNNADCFEIKWRPVGAARAVFYDLDAFKWCLSYIKDNQIIHPIVYVLACRIGPFVSHYAHQLHNLGGILYVNPDGHEWARAKWSPSVKKYWKSSEAGMVKAADLLVCDSRNIENYIQEEYSNYNPKTFYIAYGADEVPSTLEDNNSVYSEWLKQHSLATKQYYLVVGRFVPENNYETMIREFMSSETNKSFALVAEAEGVFLNELQKRTNYKSDPRIKFVGTVYDQELLRKIRENAFVYLHGHEVGGTNPSLLEALASTELNLLLDVGFNREVAESSALYWTKEEGSLRKTIEEAESLSESQRRSFAALAKKRIREQFSWEKIVNRYEGLFLQSDRLE